MIRLASAGPLFKHGGKNGFDLNRTWSKFESLTTEQRTILRDRHGRWIRIHPDDRGELEKLGLKFVGGQEPLGELTAEHKVEKTAEPKPKPEPKQPTPPVSTTTKAKADKADEKKV